MTRARDLASLGDNTSKLEQAGLIQVIPTSVTKGASGSGSVDSKGNVTFSGTESIALNSIFTSSYQNYRILITITAKSVSDDVRMRLKTGGTDVTASNYSRAGYYSYTSGTSGHQGESAVANWGLGGVNSAAPGRTSIAIDLFNPFVAQETTGTVLTSNQDSTGYRWISLAILHDLTNAYESFTVLANSGTFSGTIRVYGYNQ